jgi:hypothetical protein
MLPTRLAGPSLDFHLSAEGDPRSGEGGEAAKGGSTMGGYRTYKSDVHRLNRRQAICQNWMLSCLKATLQRPDVLSSGNDGSLGDDRLHSDNSDKTFARRTRIPS